VADRPTFEETIALLEATLDATHDAILVVNLEQRIIRFNRRFLQMFGFTADELERGGIELMMSRMLEELEDPDAARTSWLELAARPAATRLDVLRFTDGRIYERYVAPHQIGSRIVGRVASFRDIGPSVRSAEALEQHRTFLEQAQHVAHVGSWVAELDGSERLCLSAETHHIFGIPPEAFDGTWTAFFALVHDDDRDAVRAASTAAIAGERTFDIEHRIVRPDGALRWVHERADVLRDARGQPNRMIGTVQDATDRRHLEDQLRQSQKMEAIGRLAGGIAHDLNNALTAIAGYAELAYNELPANDAARIDVEEIRRAAARAGSVTRQLLAFSRKRLLEPRVFDLNETVESIARLLSRLLGGDVRLRTELTSGPLEVLGDPGQVEQALINLAVNARDAMPNGGQLSVTTARDIVEAERARGYVPMPAGEYILLQVADTGHGMSPDTMAHVFEPFFTTKEPGKGTGLGLSMVYGTMKQIGGFIFVDSEANRGTRFQLFFPPAPAGARRAAAAPSRPAAARASGAVLIVEDEAPVRNLVASALRHEGYELIVAASADEALEIAAARAAPIDLLLTDATMPGRSGVELAALLTARLPAMRVIIMSGYNEETLAAAPAGVDLLQKPFTPLELRRRIREALER
jgi:two-component system, cell cycle sensor histidine kinase and response regulator CckA